MYFDAKKIFFCLLFFLLFQCKEAPKQTEILAEVPPNGKDISEMQLTYIDTLFNEYIQKDWIPGSYRYKNRNVF